MSRKDWKLALRRLVRLSWLVVPLAINWMWPQAALFGCKSDQSSSSGPTATASAPACKWSFGTLAISPTEVTVDPGGTVQFAATLDGRANWTNLDNSGCVAWSSSDSESGDGSGFSYTFKATAPQPTLSTCGVTDVTYTAPTVPGDYTVTVVVHGQGLLQCALTAVVHVSGCTGSSSGACTGGSSSGSSSGASSSSGSGSSSGTASSSGGSSGSSSGGSSGSSSGGTPTGVFSESSTIGDVDEFDDDPLEGPLNPVGSTSQLVIPQGNIVLLPTYNVDSYTLQKDMSLIGNGSTPMPVNLVVTAMAATSDGKYVYGGAINSQGGQNQMLQWGWSTNQGGVVAPLSPATLPLAGGYPYHIAIDPTNKYLYVAMTFGGTVQEYTIGTGGTLTAAGSTTVGAAADSIAITPAGSALFALDSKDSYVAQYSIGAGGALTPATPATVATPSTVGDAGPNDDGGDIELAQVGGQTYAYVLLTALSNISTYGVSGGLLSPTNGGPVMVSPRVPNQQGCQNMAVDTLHGILAIACPQNNQLWGFTIGAGGSLTGTSWSPLTTNLDVAGGTHGPIYVSYMTANL